jgi:hypothetical protein
MSFTFEEIANSLVDQDSFIAPKYPKSEFLYKNIIAIPHFLTKSFVQLESSDGYSVAKVFSLAIMDFDNFTSDKDTDTIDSKLITTQEGNDDPNGTPDDITESSESPTDHNDQSQGQTMKQSNKPPIPLIYYTSSSFAICVQKEKYLLYFTPSLLVPKSTTGLNIYHLLSLMESLNGTIALLTHRMTIPTTTQLYLARNGKF